MHPCWIKIWIESKLPVVTAVVGHTISLHEQRPLMVTRAAVERHTGVIEQIETRRTVTAIITLGGTLHILRGIQTHSRTRAALSLALSLIQEAHAVWTHTCSTHTHTSQTRTSAEAMGRFQQVYVWFTRAGLDVAVSCLYVRPGTAEASVQRRRRTAEALSRLNTRVTLRWTHRPAGPGRPATVHYSHTRDKLSEKLQRLTKIWACTSIEDFFVCLFVLFFLFVFLDKNSGVFFFFFFWRLIQFHICFHCHKELNYFIFIRFLFENTIFLYYLCSFY